MPSALPACCKQLTWLRVYTLLQALWLVGGRQHDADELFWKVLGLQRAGPVLIPQETLAAAYSQEMGIRDGAPSTGFVGELCIGNVISAWSHCRVLGYCRSGPFSRCKKSICCYDLSLAERTHEIIEMASTLPDQEALWNPYAIYMH